MKFFKGISVHSFADATGRYVGYHIKPQTLLSDDKRTLVDTLYEVAQSAFAQEPSKGFYQDVFDHITKSVDLVVMVCGDAVVAFLISDIIMHDTGNIVYLAGICIKVSHQSQGLGKTMVSYVAQYYDNFTWRYMVLRTQNPVMQRCLRGYATSGTFYTYGDAIPEEIQSVACCVAGHISDQKLDAPLLLSRGVYGGTLYGPAYRLGEKISGTVFSGLNVNAGDAVYCVWQR